MLFHYAIRYVNSSENVESCDKILKEFLSRSTSETNNEHLAHLTKSLKKLKPGYEFPDIKLIDFNNSEEFYLDYKLISSPVFVGSCPCNAANESQILDLIE